MRSPGGRLTEGAAQLTADMHREAVHDVTSLQDSRILLVQRLERVMTALALTLDAEAAAEERLARIQELAGVQRISNRPAAEWSLLAQRYRDLIHAVESVTKELHLDRGRTRP